jgi:hypothetical protein
MTLPTRDLEPELLLSEQASPDMRFATRQMAAINRELSQRNRHVLRTAGRWLDLFDYVKMLEEDHFLSPDALIGQRQFFIGTVAVVRGLGTLLLGKLQNDDAEQLKALGVAYRDLVACVEELADLERGLQSDLSNEMIAEMNKQLFGSGQPA